MGQQERREGTNGNGVGTTEKRDASGRIDRYAEPRTRPQQMRGLARILIFFRAMAFTAAPMQLVRSSDTLYLKGVAIGAVLSTAGLHWMRLAE